MHPLVWCLLFTLASAPAKAETETSGDVPVEPEPGYKWPGWPGPSFMPPPPPPPKGPPPGFDYLVLSEYWPPTQVPPDAHSRARHLMHMKQANPGFWTHGLWPSRFATTKQPQYCTTELFRPEDLDVFEDSLMYYLRSPLPTALPAKLHTFWSHEWARHGTCYGGDQLTYFFAVYQASARLNLYAALAAAGITPRNDKPYAKGEIQGAFSKRFGTAFGADGIACQPSPLGGQALSSVRICLDAGLNPVPCTKPKAYSKAATNSSSSQEAPWGVVSRFVRSARRLHADAHAADMSADVSRSSTLSAWLSVLQTITQLRRYCWSQLGWSNAVDQEEQGLVPPGWTMPRDLAAWALSAAVSGRGLVRERTWRGRDAPLRSEPLNDWAAGESDTECLGDPSAPIWVPDWQDDATAHVPWDIVLGLGGLAAAVVGLLYLGHHLAQRWRSLPTLFVSRPITIVHYAPVQLPVNVLCEELDMEWMWTHLPEYAEFVDGLPMGMGIKGGIARKLLKEKVGRPEPAGSFDVDVLLFIDTYTNDIRAAAREAVAGMRLGGLILEPQDVEVLTKGYLTEYFMTRDVTMNEVLILKTAPDTALFLYTEDARRDAAVGLIRPCVHCLKTEYHLAWSIEDDGTPYTASQQVVRSVVRYLKGHGQDYAFDKNTWAHYRKNKLTKTELFKVLKPFHDQDEKMQAAVDHLMSIGFLARADVRKAGGVNLLWGLLLEDLNKQVARHGGRLMLVELNPEAVERWVDHKKASVAAQLVSQEMRARRTGFAPSEENIVELGGLHFPVELHSWIESGQVFDLRSHLSRATYALLGGLQDGGAASSGTTNGQAIVPTASSNSGTAGAAQAKARWLAVKAAAAAQGGAVYSVAKEGASRQGSATNLDHLGDFSSHGVPAAASSSPSATKALLAGELCQEVTRLKTVMKAAPVSPEPGTSKQDPMRQVRTLEALQEVSKAAGKRINRGFKAMLGGLSRGGSVTAGELSSSEPAGRQDPEANAPAGPSAVDPDDLTQRQHLVLGAEDPVLYTELKEKLPEQSVALPGTFYQVVGTFSGEEEGEYVPLVSDKEAPSRKRVEIVRLVRFLLGVMALEHRLLIAAYVLLLSGLVARLCLPRIEAAIFDAFNDLDSGLFRSNLLLSLVYIGADILLTLLGNLMLELFARRAMRITFRRFFQHVIFQDLPFFDRLSPGELMARTSGDSLTMRTLVCTTMYQVVEGVILFLGSLAFLMWSSAGMLGSKPGITLTFLFVVAANAVEGVLLGQLLRRLNLAVRQALGRMFGFTLDAFSRLDTVAALGLEPRMLADYKMFARDYFRNTFFLNASMHAHRAFTTLLAAVMRAALLWFGGAALFADRTTVGALFAMLRYVSWLQKGMQETSNACMRLMAGMGSVERIVELHDRGVFGATPEAAAGHECSNGYSPAVDGGSSTTTVVHREQRSFRNLFAPRTPTRRHQATVQSNWTKLVQPLLAGDADEEDEREEGETVTEVSEIKRPDWQAFMGGIKLVDIHLTKRSRTDKLLLHDCTFTLMPGEALLVSGEEVESKSGLMGLVMLRMVPYKGSIAYQLPDDAIPPSCMLGDMTTQSGPLTGGDGWKWVPFSFRLDAMEGLRSCIALASIRVAGVFRTSLEDNIAVATHREVTNAEVREVCRKVGLYDTAMQLPDGFGTVVGEGSGNPLSQVALLKIVMARCLLRQPKLLLLDDADVFSDALGPSLLAEVLQGLCQQGCAVIIASSQRHRWPFASKVFTFRNGRPMTASDTAGTFVRT